MNQPSFPVRRIEDADYVALAAFRAALRGFLRFSERRATAEGLTPQQHQTLLLIRAAPSPLSIGEIAEKLMLKANSASELVERLEMAGLVQRKAAADDRRRMETRLTGKAEAILAALSTAHRDELRRMRPLLKELLDRLD